MKLLEIAKGIKTNRKPGATAEEEELVMAWAHEEITYSQAARALENVTGHKTNSAFYTLAAYVLKDVVTRV